LTCRIVCKTDFSGISEATSSCGNDESTIRNTKFYCNDSISFIYYWDIVASVSDFFGKSTKTKLYYSDFDGVVLEDVDFSNANLENVQNLSKAKSKNVCGNSKTIWPSDFSFPNCE
jgi:uncharacterized protein YjbI with pentapeptide repeats